MWMNVDDLAKKDECMWMTIHLHPPSSTFNHIHADKKFIPRKNNKAKTPNPSPVPSPLGGARGNRATCQVIGATGFSRACSGFKLLCIRGLRGWRGDFCRTPSHSVAVKKERVNGHSAVSDECKI